MRSSEARNLKLFEMRKKNQNFRAIGNQLHSNAFQTTQTAHCALWQSLKLYCDDDRDDNLIARMIFIYRFHFLSNGCIYGVHPPRIRDLQCNCQSWWYCIRDFFHLLASQIPGLYHLPRLLHRCWESLGWTAGFASWQFSCFTYGWISFSLFLLV